MKEVGRYSPLHEAHRRARQQAQVRKEAHSTAMEITDRKLERRDRDQALPQRRDAERGRDAAANPAQPARPVEVTPHTLVPDSPAPGESEGHFAWRRLVTQRIEREHGQKAAQKADEIPRILRTEANPISRSTELKAAFDRLEAGQAQSSANKTDKEKAQSEKEIEPGE